MHGSDTSSEALMLRWIAGDASAFRELFDRFAPVVLRIYLRQGIAEADATDLVQQTFLALHRARNDFRQDAPFRPWLFTIAFNLGRQHFRRLGIRREREVAADLTDEPVAPFSDPSEGLENDALAMRVRAAVGALPLGQREVVVLHWFEGRPFSEVAAIVGASESAVKVRAHRAYERLREALRDAATASSSEISDE